MVEKFLRTDFLLPLIFLILTVILTGIDVLLDLAEGTSWQHVTIEMIVIAVGLVGAILIGQKIIDNYQSQITRTQDEAERLRLVAESWKKEAQSILKGLALQIDQQFTNWQFTPAEKEVAMFLIKGLSIKDIAEIREVKERTVRQQCMAIYRKSGLAGRSELSAFFLEDLLLPDSLGK
ncbi:MAG: helix-turn-helix transcriptional regulator [Oligoflexus sp.]